MKRYFSLLVGAVVMATGACSIEDETPAATAPSVEVQPDRPILAGVVVTPRGGFGSEGRWSDARDLVIDAEQNIYLLDGAVPASILKFGSDGRYVMRFGEDEPDPTQVVLAQEMSLAPSWNTILVADRSQQTVNSFLTLGMLTYSVKTDGVPIDVVGLPAFGEYYLQGWDQALNRSGVYHMRLPLDTLGTTYEVQLEPSQPVRKTARDVYFHATADDESRLYVAFHDGYPVRVLDPDGTTVRVVAIDRRPVVRGAEEVAAETEENLVTLRREAPDVPDSLLMEAARADSVLPMIEELAVDPSRRLWVRTNREDAVGKTTYDVFDAEGRYLARVDVPGDVRATAFAPDGSLVVIDEAGDAAGAVARYEVGLEAPPGD